MSLEKAEKLKSKVAKWIKSNSMELIQEYHPIDSPDLVV